MGAAEEDLLVAMAMSRSLHEEEEAKSRLLTSRRPNRPRPRRKNPRGEKKSRVMPPHSPPTLLLQDPERARRQTEERVALLLSEADEFPSTPPLPPSRLLASELSRKADWPVAVPKGPPSSLWERSSLGGPICVAGTTLPALPWQTDQRLMQSTALPLLGSVRPEAEERLPQERGGGRDLPGKSPREERGDVEGCSQREEGALQDLMELAGEGLTLTQWNSATQPAEEQGPEWVPGDVPQSSLDQAPEKKLPLGSRSSPFLLGLLAAAFKGMVNNPHLSDVQFQVDTGELFYAHLFVLYARCPQLMEVVDQKGFWVAEEGEAKARRVLLSDVSGEAAGVFLNYLYTAEHLVPPHVLPGVAALAQRFGVAELAALCTSRGWRGQPAVGASGEEEEERMETFEELLKSIWVGEEEEDKALLPEEPGSENVVAEQELEEIYEFAATQRKAAEERSSRVAEAGASPMEEEGAGPGDSSEGKGSLAQLQGQDARKEAVPGLPLEPPQGAEEQRPLGAAGRRPLEGLSEELAEASRELDEKSLFAVSWGESLELFQQSDKGEGGPSDDDEDAAGDNVAVIQSSTPLGLEKGPVLLPRNFPSGGSQVLLGVLADKLPASPIQRGGFCSDLSLPLFSPAPPEARGKPCRSQELQRAASAGTAAGSGADSIRYAPAPLPSPLCPPGDLVGGPVPMLGPGDERKLSQGEWPAERVGVPSKEQEAFGALKGPLSLEVDIPCCQGRGAPLLGTLLGGEAEVGGERMPGTPLLTRRGPEGGQAAKLGLTSGPESPQPGDAQDSHPTQKPSAIPSPKRLQSRLPPGPRSPSPWPSARLPRDGKPVADVVVILDDSEEEAEAEAAPGRSWGSSVLEVDLPVSEDDSGHLFLVASPEGSVATKASSCQLDRPPRPLLMRNGTPPPGGSRSAGREPLPHFGCTEEGSCSSDGSRRWRLDLGGQGDETEILPLPRRLPAPVPVPKMPDLVCQEREAPCTSPPTPVPSYSIMETPVLKKELSRFGVRTLPKPQMVLKLKEIFQYTHQRSDSSDATTSSQPGLCRGTQAALRRPTLAPTRSGFPKHPPRCSELPQVPLAGGRFEGSSGTGDRGQGQMPKRGCLPAGSGRRKRAAVGPARGGQMLTASQKAEGLSGAASDTSFVLQSSSTEFETSVLAEEEEDIPASQSACREADMLVALRQYIHSRPALCRQILFYQPFELARLQSELKQNGIRIALGRLLEFLDAHCITFTTAEARREKKQQQREHQRGRRRRRY